MHDKEVQLAAVGREISSYNKPEDHVEQLKKKVEQLDLQAELA